MVFKITITSKSNINIFSIDSYGWIMPVLNKHFTCKQYRSSQGNHFHKQKFMSMDEVQCLDTIG